MNLDDMLQGLREAPPHPGLTRIDGAELAAIGRARALDIKRPALLAGASALLIGMAGSLVPANQAEASVAASPFGAATPLAPSTLLGG